MESLKPNNHCRIRIPEEVRIKAGLEPNKVYRLCHVLHKIWVAYDMRPEKNVGCKDDRINHG